MNPVKCQRHFFSKLNLYFRLSALKWHYTVMYQKWLYNLCVQVAYYDEIAGLYENAPVMFCQPLTMANIDSAFALNNHCPTAGLEASQNQGVFCAICSGNTPKNCCWVLICDAALPGTRGTRLCCRNRACVQSAHDAKDSNVVGTCGELVRWPYTVI